MEKRTGVPGQAWLILIATASTVTAVFMLSNHVAVGQSVSPATIAHPAKIMALPIEIRPGYEGIAIIDLNHCTICIYQYQVGRPIHERFVLLAARSFRYDCQLEEFNTGRPLPGAVKDLLQRARQIKSKAIMDSPEAIMESPKADSAKKSR